MACERRTRGQNSLGSQPFTSLVVYRQRHGVRRVYCADVGERLRGRLFEAQVCLLAPADKHHRADSHAEQNDTHGDANSGTQRKATGRGGARRRARSGRQR